MKIKSDSKILGFDIDDVIADFWATATPIFNKKYGVEASKHDFVTFSSMNDIYGIEYPDFFRTVIEEGVLEIMNPYKGVPEIMRDLHDQGHRIILVTSRSYHSDAHNVTEAFLDKNDIPFHELYIKEDGKTKADYLPSLTDVFLDDLPSNLKSIAESGKVGHLALINQPWNQDDSNFKRYSGLKQFYKTHFSRSLESSLAI